MTMKTTMPDGKADQTTVPGAAWVLGLAGLIPFVALSLSLVMDTGINQSWATLALLTYGAIILSFMSGVHWGLAVRGPIEAEASTASGPSDTAMFISYAVSVIPALIGWFALIALNPGPAMAVMAAAFAALLAYDFHMINRGYAPKWYGTLRIPLTAVVVIALLVGGSAGAYGV